MSKSRKKSETESELYYVIEKVKIINKGGVIIMQSGQPTPPVTPPKGGQ